MADCQRTFFRCFKQFGKFLKKVAERSRDSRRRSSDRRPTVKQPVFHVSSKPEIFSKRSLNGQAIVVGGHATVGRLSNIVGLRLGLILTLTIYAYSTYSTYFTNGVRVRVS